MSPNSASEEAGVEAQTEQHTVQEPLTEDTPQEPAVPESSPDHTDQDVIAAEPALAESEQSPASDRPATEVSEAVSKSAHQNFVLRFRDRRYTCFPETMLMNNRLLSSKILWRWLINPKLI